MTEMFGEAWSPMSVPDLAPDDDDDDWLYAFSFWSANGFMMFNLECQWLYGVAIWSAIGFMMFFF